MRCKGADKLTFVFVGNVSYINGVVSKASKCGTRSCASSEGLPYFRAKNVVV